VDTVNWNHALSRLRAQRRSQAASAGPAILGYTAGIRRSILQKIRSPTEGRAMPDEVLTIEQFNDKVGQTFALDEADAPAIPLTLTEAKPLRNYANAKREPFSLLFTSQGDFVLPQRIYGLRHDVLGPVSIFLVPLSHEGGITTYQAIFN
jgi:hypothetical protein